MTVSLVEPVRVALVAYARAAGCCSVCAVNFGQTARTASLTLLQVTADAERMARACVGAGHHGNGGPS